MVSGYAHVQKCILVMSLLGAHGMELSQDHGNRGETKCSSEMSSMSQRVPDPSEAIMGVHGSGPLEAGVVEVLNGTFSQPQSLVQVTVGSDASVVTMETGRE